MKTRKLNGLKLEAMLRNGLKNLMNREQEINELNVFPVPDGDTGTNMRLTLEHGLSAAKSIPDVGAYLKALSDGMLLGARGNSGVILSQLFRGIFLALRHASTVNCGDVRNALILGYKTSYGAVIRPVEGTMLTVAREGIENIRTQITRMTSIDELIGMYVAEMRLSLKRTPELLPVLSEAGVVDSGAYGYITIMEGMQKSLYGEEIELNGTPLSSAPGEDEEELPSDEVDSTLFNEDSAFEDGYCVSFVLQLMHGENYAHRFREKDFISDLSAYGNSIVTARVDNRVKVHVHSLKPGKILGIAQEYGEFISLKIDNMQIQHNAADREKARKKMPIHRVISKVAVANGEGFRKAFSEFGCDVVLNGGMTMNSAANDFVEAFRKLDADCIVVFPNNKNIFMAAEQAKKLCPELRIEIIETRDQASCYAALQMDVQDSTDIGSRIAFMRRGMERVSALHLARATRHYEAKDLNCEEGDVVALFGGEPLAAGAAFPETFIKALNALPDIDEKEAVLIFTGASFDEALADEITDAVSAAYPMMDVTFLPGGQPVYTMIAGVL